MCCIIVFIETFSFRDDFIFGQTYFITLESVSSFISLKTPQLFYTIPGGFPEFALSDKLEYLGKGGCRAYKLTVVNSTGVML